MEAVYVVGVGMTPFGRLLDTSIKDMTRQAVDAALADAGLAAGALQGAYFANASQGHMEGQQMIRGQVALRAMGIGGITVVNVENACASGSSALSLAVSFVRGGEGDVAEAGPDQAGRPRLAAEPREGRAKHGQFTAGCATG